MLHFSSTAFLVEVHVHGEWGGLGKEARSSNPDRLYTLLLIVCCVSTLPICEPWVDSRALCDWCHVLIVGNTQLNEFTGASKHIAWAKCCSSKPTVNYWTDQSRMKTQQVSTGSIAFTVFSFQAVFVYHA